MIFFSLSMFIQTGGILLVAVYKSVLEFEAHALVCSHASICLIIHEIGKHCSSGSWGIHFFFHIHQFKEKDRKNFVSSILQKINNYFDCTVGTTASHWWDISCGEDSKGQFYTRLMNRRMLCLEPTGCYTRESICSRTDQGWNDSDLGPYKQTDEGNVQKHERFIENGCQVNSASLSSLQLTRSCVQLCSSALYEHKDRLHFKRIWGKEILIMSECSSNGAVCCRPH